MKKPEKTPEEIAEALAIKELQKATTIVKNMVKDLCKSRGIRVVELQLEFLKNNDTILPHPLFNRAETIKIFEIGIKEYKNPPLTKKAQKELNKLNQRAA